MIVDATDFGLSTAASYSENDASIMAASASLASTGGVVYIPSGVYDVGGFEITQRGVEIHGAARQGSRLRPVVSTGDVVKLTAWDTAVRNISIYGDTFRTSGANVVLDGARSWADNVLITRDMLGIRMSGVTSRITGCYLIEGAANSIRVQAEGGDKSQLIDAVTIGAQASAQPMAGIRVKHSSALTISNCNVLTAGNALLVDPGEGELVSSLIVNNTYLDSSQRGALIRPGVGGNVTRISFRGSWMGGSSGGGLAIQGRSGSVCDGISVVGCDFIGNAASGIELLNCRGIDISGNKIADNIHGIWVGSNVNDFSIMDNLVGQGAGVPANSGWGVVINAASDRYIVANNRMTGNGSGKVTGHTASSNKVAANNIG